MIQNIIKGINLWHRSEVRTDAEWLTQVPYIIHVDQHFEIWTALYCYALVHFLDQTTASMQHPYSVSTELYCTHQSVPHNTHSIHKYVMCTNTVGLTKSHAHCITWHPNIFIFVLLCFLPFFSKFVIILNEVNQFTNFMSEREEARSLPEFKTEETIIGKVERPWWHPVSYPAKWERHIPKLFLQH